MKLNMSGKWFNVVSYGLNDKEEIDYDQVEKLAEENKPKIIIAGASAYSLHIDFKRFSEIAKKVGVFHCTAPDFIFSRLNEIITVYHNSINDNPEFSFDFIRMFECRRC